MKGGEVSSFTIISKRRFSNGSINVIMKCDNLFAALSGNGIAD